MPENPIKNRLYMGAIKALRRLFAERYPEGGWLPPGREMAKELGLCDRTYWKALERMVRESFAQSHPRKGHFVVPARFRCRKVGLVVGDGSESPFLPSANDIGEALTQLQNRGLHAHLIQGSSPEQVQENAVIHGVEGLLWFHPSRSAATAINDIAAEAYLPLVLVNHIPWGDGDVCEVSPDLERLSELRAKTMLARGHRALGYAGPLWYAQRFGLLSTLAKAGVTLPLELCGEAGELQATEIAAQVERLHLTGLIAEGCGFHAFRLFEALSALPEGRRPEVLPADPSLCPEFPKLKFVILRQRTEQSLGKLAATLMANRLLDGAPLASAHPKLIEH